MRLMLYKTCFITSHFN